MRTSAPTAASDLAGRRPRGVCVKASPTHTRARVTQLAHLALTAAPAEAAADAGPGVSQKTSSNAKGSGSNSSSSSESGPSSGEQATASALWCAPRRKCVPPEKVGDEFGAATSSMGEAEDRPTSDDDCTSDDAGDHDERRSASAKRPYASALTPLPPDDAGGEGACASG
jgi:hypothetical protein